MPLRSASDSTRSSMAPPARPGAARLPMSRDTSSICTRPEVSTAATSPAISSSPFLKSPRKRIVPSGTPSTMSTSMRARGVSASVSPFWITAWISASVNSIRKEPEASTPSSLLSASASVAGSAGSEDPAVYSSARYTASPCAASHHPEPAAIKSSVAARVRDTAREAQTAE